MPAARRPLTPIVLASLFLLAATGTAGAQQQPVAAPAPDQPEFLPRFDFHLTIDRLLRSQTPQEELVDERFSWDTHYGGSFDLVDYVGGRATVTVGLSGGARPASSARSIRTRGTTSWKRRCPDARAIGPRSPPSFITSRGTSATGRNPSPWPGTCSAPASCTTPTSGTTTFDVAIEGGRVVQRSFVDYSWHRRGEFQVRHPLQRPRWHVRCTARGSCSLSTRTVIGRSGQAGGRIEAGIRLNGRGGAMEMFAGYERRSTPTPSSDFRSDGASSGCAYSVDNQIYMASVSRLLAAALLVGGIVAATTQPSTAASRPPKLQYQITTLPNGLTVVLSEDHSTPIVHVQLVYHVGSKNEKPGRTGFAHLFEHLMFKGSKNVQPEAHTSMLASVGGQSNAYTTDDETVFWETVPAQYLPLVLWLEADRMATLRIDKDTFTNERDVVKEERRMRVDNQPYGRLNEIIYDQAFTRASLQARDDRQHAGSRGGVGRGRARFLRDLLRAGERDAGAGRRLRFGAGAAAGEPVHRPRAEGGASGAARHPAGAAADEREACDAAAAVAAAGGRRRLSRDQRRQPRRLSAAHRGQGAVRRPDVAHLPEAGLRKADGGRRVRQRQPDRASEPVLRRRHRAAGQIARRSRPTR